MSGCSDLSSMTGSMSAGLLQPPKDTAALAARFPSGSPSARRGRQRPSRKTTMTPPNGQPIQLTPLWEHVVRTRRFPSEIDTRLTFLEISERLRDPEWEVRQHALRVLIDVLPTLNGEVVDKVMQPVVPELINNLGHPAPAVRKGALDALRVYLVHSRDREETVKKILEDGLNRSEARDPFQTNVTTGVILSAPSLLFPSSSSPSPGAKLIKETTIALASRLAQVPHQEAVLKSLMKIRDAVGVDEFEGYLEDYDNKLKRNIEILAKIYNIKSRKTSRKRTESKGDNPEKNPDHRWDSDSDTSGIAEEEDEVNGVMPPARVVLETEIKFNEETAITMTILEEKEDSEKEQDEESGTDVRNDTEISEVKDGLSDDRKKTPRRVHFGGEIVKLRTPDSDETESIEVTPKTRIPVPVSPATKMPPPRPRPSSQPCSPRRERRKPKRTSRSVSNSPKREVYTHNAELSPKKSILTRTNSPLPVVRSADQTKKRKIKEDKERNDQNETGGMKENPLKYFEPQRKMEEVTKKGEKFPQTFHVDSNILTDLEDSRNSTRNEKQVKSEVPGSRETTQNSMSNSKEDTLPGHRVKTNERNSAKESSRPQSKISNNEVIQEKSDSTNILDDSVVDLSIDLVSQGNESDSKIKGSGDVEKSEGKFREKRVENIQGSSTQMDKVAPAENDISRNDQVITDRGSVCSRQVIGERDLRNSGERPSRGDRDKRSASAIEKNGNVAGVEAEGKSVEPSWEELGLVDQEVLEDLHNREDWRARVRGLERVASALRTSSALIAIEPRLGSLLHAVLGCERSCRVAAAGLAVAKVIVAGVNEEALKKRLPQLAWGLARQGGPSAAQLARVAMLRLRPALLLEQFLMPQCLNARNAKTRENALQLLIFSLVTFPSTEFKVDTVASKVAKMVGDRRRRVRQAALDTLAVLAQIYEPEEVLAAGKRAAEGRHDGEAMLSAIRARLARKSLPLVSADGLVVYGLQISPTVQIATGPDVDWIVAGSGSVSPGTGRTKGQVIPTRSEKGRLSRNVNTKTRDNPWIDRTNLVALGVGMQTKSEQNVAWQIIPAQNQDDIQCEDQLNVPEVRGINTENRGAKTFDSHSRTDQSTSYRTAVENSSDHRSNFKNVDATNKEVENAITAESRIPILFRERVSKFPGEGHDRPANFESTSANSRRRSKDSADNSSSQMNSQDSIGPHGVMYQRRKRFQEFSPVGLGGQVLNQSFDSSYNNNYPATNFTDSNKNYTDIVETTSQDLAEISSRSYQKFMEKDRFVRKSDTGSRYSRSNSSDSQQSLPRNVQQHTFLMHNMYTSHPRRDTRFPDENSFRTLHTAPAPLSRIYDEESFVHQVEGDDNRSVSSRTRSYRRTKDAAAQKINEVELISSDAQTNGHFPAIHNEPPYRRRLRSLSPSQLYCRQQFAKLASSEVHAMSMYEIDKAVNEEEYNERNRRHFLPASTEYHTQELNAETPFEVEDRESINAKSASSSSSDVSRINRQQRIEEKIEDRRDFSDSRSSSPRSRDVDAAFDVISHQASPSRDVVDSFDLALGQQIDTGVDATITSIDDDNTSKEWSSEEDAKLPNRSRPPSECEIPEYPGNQNESDTSDETIRPEEEIRRRSVVSVISDERFITNEDLNESFDDKQASPINIASPRKSETCSRTSSRNSDFAVPKSPAKRSPRKLSFDNEIKELTDSSEERVVSVLEDDFQPEEQIRSRRESIVANSPTIIIASRPHSIEATSYIENKIENDVESNDTENPERFIDPSTVNGNSDDRQSKDSASETNTEPGILKIETHPVEPINPTRRPSKVPRGTMRLRGTLSKGNSEKPEKPRPIVQQCFNQLESKDWEVTMKGLKALSQITKQHPEYLDNCATGTIGRLLGRQVKSLRSQVARAACAAAGDVFSSQIRGIDQDIDDIAGPLLHRTADTNRFLRSDSNAALDLMIEHLPPHKTIGIIVHRGGSHQNAIVRAATGRLLATIVDRVGPEHIMILPRDARDKLLSTAARLLIDGNLDARNHAKKMFRRVMNAEGFRRALTDAVPETTLRHIDKTLKSL